MLHPKPRRLFAFGALAGFLLGLTLIPARADDFKISATLGIGGRYRAGTWLPVTVSVLNTGSDAVHGQVQLYDDQMLGDASSLFARPADIAPGPTPQTFQVYTRSLDPDRADVVARLVSGSGDGRVLAQISSLSTTGRPAFSGSPVADRDPLVVGVSADASAFTFLNGQKWGLMHTTAGLALEPPNVVQTPGGPPAMRGQRTNPASVQTAAATPADLPDKPAGYGGVDAVILRADAPLDSLTEAQTDALKGWVAAGGHLLVCGGADPTPLSNAFYNGLLPASLSPATPALGAGGALGLTPKPLPGVRVVASDAGRPTIVAGPFGAGRVTLIAYDTQTIRGWSSPVQAAFWKQALSGQSSSLLRVVASREEGGSRFYGYYSGWDQLSDAVMRAPALDAPGAGVVGLFLLAYVLVLVPINYLVLKRMDKKEWAWVTVPVLVVVFAATTYGVGYAAKGSTVFVNRAAVVETAAGERQAGLYTEIGLFSPHRTSYDMTVADPNALAAIPIPPDDDNYYGRRGQSSPGSYGRTRFVETSGDTKMQDAAVNMWAMRAFDVQTTTDLGGAVTAALAFTPQTGQLRGTLANHTAHDLTECHLCVNGQWQSLNDLPAGGTQAVATVFPAGPFRGAGAQGWSQMPTILGRNDKNDPDSDVRQRMRAALHDFVRDLGNDPTNGQNYGGNYTPPALFQPGAGEALLTGWSNDSSLPGPPLRVDEHSVTQNNVTFVVVHIPL